MELCPEFDECDCSTNTNVVTDLEKMELGLEIAGAVLDGLLPIDELQAMKDSMLAFPDHAVKLVDAIQKSNDGVAWSEFAEAAGALIDLVKAGAEVIGKANLIYKIGDIVVKLAIVVNDLTTPDSPLCKLFSQAKYGEQEAIDKAFDDGANNIVGSMFCDTIQGMGGDDYLYGGKGQDKLYGGENNDLLIGGECNDYLDGGNGEDNLGGGDGNDVLIGGLTDNVRDNLEGDGGFDTYLAGSNDIVSDEDGKGEVYFDETLLTGGKKEAGSGCEPTEDDGSSVYKGNGGTYTLSGDTLTFEKGGETLTMLNLNDKRMAA